MKHLIKYNIFEKLGIINELEIIADDILSKIGNNNYLSYKLNYLNHNITINIFHLHNKKYLGDFQVEDNKKHIFNIRLNYLHKNILIHELKHLDRCIRRNFKTDGYFYINHIGSVIINNYNFLFKNDDDINLLLDTFYFCNPDEFETHYHDLYYYIKNNFDKNSDNKYTTIKNIIENEYIYKIYKYYYKNKFNLLDFFDSYKDCNIFLNEFIHRQELFYNKENETPTFIDKIRYWFKSKLNYIKDKEINNKELLKDINYHINKIVRKNFKKFNRLYTIFN